MPAFLNLNRYRGRIEEAASKALNMTVRIRGGIGFSVLPFLKINMNDVNIANRGRELFSAAGISIAPDLRALVLNKNFQVRGIALNKPVIFIEKDRDGIYNFETGSEAGSGQSLPLSSFSVKNGEAVYLDAMTGERDFVKGLDARIKIQPGGTGQKGFFFTGSLRASGSVRLKSLQIDNVYAYDLNSGIRCEKGVIDFSQIRAGFYGGKAEGSLRIETAGDDTRFKLEQKLSGVDLEQLLPEHERRLRGKLDAGVDLAAEERDGQGLSRNLRGEISAKGKDITIKTVDIDKVIEKYERSQNFNLLDIGSVFVAGPFGPLLTKGYAYADLYRQVGRGESRIREFVSAWRIEKGIAEARDVAFSTRKNRVAFRGGLDLVNERYQDFTVAVLDKKGCARIKQEITGPFNNPKPAGIGAKAVIAPLESIFSKVKNLVAPSCKPFYTGSVRQP